MKAHAKIATLLKQAMGLDVATIGPPVFDHAVRLRMAACNDHDVQSYWERLRNSETELQELIEAVVVPETWFFRDREAFAVLGSIIMKEWLPAHPSRLLRALSLPCSSGEEPYSIVMALLDAGLAPQRFHVDAVDISVRALALARRAVFGKNSFRGEDLTFRDQYFSAGREGYQLAEEVRGRVHFHSGNILAADFLSDAEPYDVVFCRNVLIYFDAATQKRLIGTLGRLLAPDGVMFVGPSEAFVVRSNGFVSSNHARAFAYRKPTISAGASHPGPEPGRKAKSRSALAAKRGNGSSAQGQVRIPREAAGASDNKVGADLELARHLADTGRLEEAARVCEAVLEEHGASANAYHLLGVIHDASGDHGRAAACYRKVIYLDPNHSEALMHLSLLAEKQGDAATARRLQMRAQRVTERTSR